MNQETSPQFENFGANVANKSMIVMNLFQMADKIFIDSKIAITFSAFVFIYNPF